MCALIVQVSILILSYPTTTLQSYKEEKRVAVIIQQKDSCHSHQCVLARKHEDMQTLDGKHSS